MTRTALTLLLGLAVGTATHALYYRHHRTAPAETLDEQLAWMKSELQLSDAQFAKIETLHQASSPRLRALAAQVAQLQKEFEAFENTRRTSDTVDFIEFARFVEQRRNVSRECLDSTRRLVHAAADVMTPIQRERYLGLVRTVEPQAAL